MSSIDIAVPCYQYGRYLRECVESILNQGIENIRVLIVDNASTDETPQVAQRLSKEDARVSALVRSRNLGPHASFNAGVDWASAKYFMVLCADDLLAPGALRSAMEVLEENPGLSFAFGTDQHLFPGAVAPKLDAESPVQWKVSSGDAFIEERCRNPEHYLALGMVLVRTSAQKRAGHYRSELPHTDDFEMMLRLARLGGGAHTPAVLGFKRMHGANRTNHYLAHRTAELAERVAAIDSFFAHEGSDTPNAKRLRRLGRRSVAERAYWCAVKDLLRGHRSCIDLFRFAFSLDPSTRLLPPVRYLARMDRSLGEILSGFRPAMARSKMDRKLMLGP